MFVGGAIGGAVGFSAIAINRMIFLSNLSPFVKYPAAIAVAIDALLLYFVLALVFSIVINGAF